ncbi:MAG: hypothetical protein PVI30_12020 [Myxococcales bacterium]|jgi:hypothetical protein
MGRLPRWALLGLSLLAGCGSCGRAGPSAGDGPTPHVRCIAGSPPAEGRIEVGGTILTIQGRELKVEGLDPPITLAAFSGPAPAPTVPSELLAALKAAAPDLVLMLGGAGDTPEQARTTLEALAGLPAPTLFLAGGRDVPQRVHEARAALGAPAERIIDVTPLQSIRVGNDTLVPVAGAAGGRYAAGPEACGHTLEDLKGLAADLGPAPADGRRYLLAWNAPGLGGAAAVARTDTGVDVGSADLAELARRVGAPGGLFAWPRVQALRPAASAGARPLSPGEAAADLRMVVPRLGAPAVERADGSRLPPGFALVSLDEHGLGLSKFVAITKRNQGLAEQSSD